MPRVPKMSSSVVQVLEVLVADPPTPRYGLELGAATGLASGTIHPVLARLEGAGWVSSAWEDVDPSSVGRPRRRFYLLTPAGLEQATAALAAVAARRERLSHRFRPAPSGSPATGVA